MSTDALSLNFRHFGSGKPLIILHGLFGSAANWQSVALRLSQDWSVYALDLRNHGDSPHSPHFGYDALAEDLKEFMAQQHIEKAVLLGHSLGGKIVMAFADRFPEKAERLIVLDVAFKAYSIFHREMLKAMIDLDLNCIRSSKEAFDWLAGAIPLLAIRQFILMSLVRDADGRYRWKINLDSIYRNLDQLSQELHLKNQYLNPTMFVRGSQSFYITEEDEARIRQYYPKARIVTIQGAGHWVHADAQEKTIEVLLDFLHS